ncbi:hypothetical protein [Microbacterium sp. NPDC077184]|uniref:hypothetical protein n=1 Tax=Microbacterium sp. NPDC077184 TaxID=3154764 RepID=UPI0034445451
MLAIIWLPTGPSVSDKVISSAIVLAISMGIFSLEYVELSRREKRRLEEVRPAARRPLSESPRRLYRARRRNAVDGSDTAAR